MEKGKNPNVTIDITDEINNVLDITEEKPKHVIRTGEDSLTIDGRQYEVVHNYHDGFDIDKLEERYNGILDKYDFIVGDWGFDQLRLRGFYLDDNKKANKDQLISTLEDYIYEFCNFGCAYFVIQQNMADKIKVIKEKSAKESNYNPKRTHHKNTNSHKPKNNGHGNTNNKPKSENKRPVNKKPTVAKKQPQKKNTKRNFTIRNLEDSK